MTQTDGTISVWSDLISAPDKAALTMFYCVFTSSHYHYRCQWERNQNLNVCVSQSSRSVWVPSGGWRRSFPVVPFTASAQLLVNCSASLFYQEAIALYLRCSPLLYYFLFFSNEPHCCLKAWCRFMNTLFSWITYVTCRCICAHIDQDRSKIKCGAQSCKCGDVVAVQSLFICICFSLSLYVYSHGDDAVSSL